MPNDTPNNTPGPTGIATVNVDSLTMDQVRELAAEALNARNRPAHEAPDAAGSGDVDFQIYAHPYKEGSAYLIRTVTMILTGRVTAVYNSELVLDDPAWIADTGRWHQLVQGDQSVLGEVEPGPGPVFVNRDSIIDVWPWTGPLPREAK